MRAQNFKAVARDRHEIRMMFEHLVELRGVDDLTDDLRCGRARITEYLASDRYYPTPALVAKIQFAFSVLAASQKLARMRQRAKGVKRGV